MVPFAWTTPSSSSKWMSTATQFLLGHMVMLKGTFLSAKTSHSIVIHALVILPCPIPLHPTLSHPTKSTYPFHPTHLASPHPILPWLTSPRSHLSLLCLPPCLGFAILPTLPCYAIYFFHFCIMLLKLCVLCCNAVLDYPQPPRQTVVAFPLHCPVLPTSSANTVHTLHTQYLDSAYEVHTKCIVHTQCIHSVTLRFQHLC